MIINKQCRVFGEKIAYNCMTIQSEKCDYKED